MSLKPAMRQNALKLCIAKIAIKMRLRDGIAHDKMHYMNGVSILENRKEYVVLKVPRRLMRSISFSAESKKEITEAQALKILRAGMAEYAAGKTKALNSLRELRDGN